MRSRERSPVDGNDLFADFIRGLTWDRFTVGEKLGIAGRRFLTALVVGYEVAHRAGRL